MTKRAKKKVSKGTNENTSSSNLSSFNNSNISNIDSSSSINSYSDRNLCSSTIISSGFDDNHDKSPEINSNVADTSNSNPSKPTSSSERTNKRKIPPTTKQNMAKKKNSNNTSISTIALDNDVDETDDEDISQSNASSVWKYATRSEDKKFAICNLCKKRVSTGNWSTSSLRRHLIQVHDKKELVLCEEDRRQQSTIKPLLKEKFHQLSVEAIIKDNLPFNAFHKSGLSKIMKEAIPGYHPIHRNVVTRRLKRLQKEKFKKLIEELNPVKYLSLTTDFWSDRLNKSYLVITGHYYTNDHQLKSTILCFSSFNHRHTSEYIANIIKKKLQDLNILHKINRVVSDGAKNISSALAMMGLDFDHVWCIAHRMHLVVTSALALWPKKTKKSAVEPNQNNNSAQPDAYANDKNQISNKNGINNHGDGNKNDHDDDDNDDFEVENCYDDDDYEDEKNDDKYDVNDSEDDQDNEYQCKSKDDEDAESEKDENAESENENAYTHNNDNDDPDDFEKDIIGDEDLFDFIDQNIHDNWSEDIEIDPDDSTLTKEQQTILSLMIKCRCLIIMIRRSSVLTLHFNNRRKVLKKARTALHDVCTRWNSTFLMIDSLKVLRPVLECFYNDRYELDITIEQIEKLNQLEITTTEWNYLYQLHSVLKVFHQATKAISASHYPTIGSAYFVLIGLKYFLTKDKDDNVIVKNMKKLLHAKIIHYFENDGDTLKTLKFHSYFDPNGFRALSDVDKKAIESDIKEICENEIIIGNQSSSSTLVSSQRFSTYSKTITSKFTSNSKRKSPMEDFLESIGQDIVTEHEKSPRAIIVDEIYNYRLIVGKYIEKYKKKLIPCFDFWKSHESTFPCLFSLAKRYLCTPATSVPAESAFSISSYIARKERSRLSSRNLQNTMFLKDKLD